MSRVHVLRIEQAFPLIPWWRADQVISFAELDALGLVLSMIRPSADLPHGDREQRMIMRRLTSRGEWKGYQVHSVGRWRYNSSFNAVVFKDERLPRDEVEAQRGDERRGRRRRRKERADDDADETSHERPKDEEVIAEGKDNSSCEFAPPGRAV